MKNTRMTKKLMAMAAAAALCACATAEEEETAEGWAYAPGEGVSFNDMSIMTAEFGLSFDSKYLTYGVVDGKDPIVTPSATATFFDWLYFGVESIYDVTKGNGKRAGYGNRAGRYTTLDAIVGLSHDFDLGETLGTLTVDVNYIYEYIRRYTDSDGEKGMDDTQYINLELSLGDLWLEPKLWIERDIMADNGTYVNFEIGHTFPLVDGESEDGDPVLAFRPSIGQGFGNTQRTRGYFSDTTDGFSHGGLMDTNVKGELTWNICECLSLSGYVAYYDYIFDRNMRHAACDYNGSWSENSRKYADSHQFVCGLALTATF